ncbi:MAG: transcriptional regulator of arginine metabolism [Blastocatellia bacterium]|jgi:transcriptional regulator of arginine metabolism|nr:transcriptional regulator of arginine metabolism [Blastocatellia bacterium]
MQKNVRQQRILSLIRAKPIGTQGELAARLQQAGVPVTQSSVSRDLEELGIVKHRGRYTIPRASGAAARGLLSLDLAGDALVIARTEPGLASAVAVEIDGAVIPEIVGTIAGEDTIFVAVGERKNQRVAMKKIWELFG